MRFTEVLKIAKIILNISIYKSKNKNLVMKKVSF